MEIDRDLAAALRTAGERQGRYSYLRSGGPDEPTRARAERLVALGLATWVEGKAQVELTETGWTAYQEVREHLPRGD